MASSAAPTNSLPLVTGDPEDDEEEDNEETSIWEIKEVVIPAGGPKVGPEQVKSNRKLTAKSLGLPRARRSRQMSIQARLRPFSSGRSDQVLR